MTPSKTLTKRIIDKFGRVVDLKKQPEVLEEIIHEVTDRLRAEHEPAKASTPPFGISWMDSWVAHWVHAENLRKLEQRDREVAAVLRGLVDLRFRERLDEIRDHLRAGPPDGGPPEPGPPPPAGPAIFSPPDGGPAEPGVPPAGPSIFSPPDGGPPEPGVPPAGPAIFSPPDAGPPEPGVPPEPPAGPSGPQAFDGGFAENPWILYWFVSIQAPQLLQVIDLHLTRRLESLQRSSRG